MTQIKEGLKIIGEVIAEELQKGSTHLTRYSLPAMDIVRSREIGKNIICKYGADAITNALDTGTCASFNYMAISASTVAEARATTTVPGSMTPTITKFMSTVINPTVVNGASTSIITWTFTFAAGAGKSAIAQFGMEADDTGAGNCFNQYKFTAVKDNTNNDLKLTYNVSVAP
jgi:hypothetical protein